MECRTSIQELAVLFTAGYQLSCIGEVDRKYGKYVLTALDKINKKAENFILSVIPTSEGVHINRGGLGACGRTKQMKTAELKIVQEALTVL